MSGGNNKDGGWVSDKWIEEMEKGGIGRWGKGGMGMYKQCISS
jgi:hypothetical protein